MPKMIPVQDPVKDTISILGDESNLFNLLFFKDGRSEDEMATWRKRERGAESKGVLVIYTGGTIGSAPQDEEDPDSPQVVFSWDRLVEFIPQLNEVGAGKINFRVDAASFADPLDSANVGPPEWSAMARIVEREQDNYEGFVIAHGTDTLVYSASALSFILHRLKQPVILTGAQLSPVEKARNDGLQNLITAIMIANPTYYRRGPREAFAEVCIFFGSKLIRGNRAKKIDADGYAAFDSPNYNVLGEAGSQLHLYPERFLRLSDRRELEVRDILNTRVVAMDVFPGIQGTQLIRQICALKDEAGDKQVQGLVLRTYGTGNVPDKSRTFLEQIEEATKDNIAIVNVTQCQKGGVEMGLYETSAVLEEIGVCSGEDITSEAALCKMMVLLGFRKQHSYLEHADILKELQSDWAGEQSHSLNVIPFGRRKDVILDSKNDRRQIILWDKGSFHPDTVSKAILRFRGATVKGEASVGQIFPRVEIKIWVGATTPKHFEDPTRCAGPYNKEQSFKPKTIMFDITEAAKRHLAVGERVPITLELSGKAAVFSWDTVELALHERSGRGGPSTISL